VVNARVTKKVISAAASSSSKQQDEYFEYFLFLKIGGSTKRCWPGSAFRLA
jgi:hypothetical protein